MNDCTKIEISLIVATAGRVDELQKLLASIARQTRTDFELIIVDQNTDDRIEQLLKRLQLPFTCVHASSALGASKARNVGIKQAQGNILGFPDDDCWYPLTMLAQVKEWFDRNSHYDFLCCSAQDENHNEVAARWPSRSVDIDRATVLRACNCSSLFIRRTAAVQTGGFDESMGPGPETTVKATEENDFALRLMAGSYRGRFEKSLHIFHPRKEAGSGTTDRALNYGIGFGFLLRKHDYPIYTLAYHVIRPLGGIVRAFSRASLKEVRFYWKSAIGRLIGYINTNTLKKTPIQS